ncbi:hypothetical protein IV54_GL001223 [Levilactobacillus paucivorans]|uniref:Uncharacterized protein n=1 Tax=Levilactobacillus paucivorans TaxID=616990 RepID=A0A0R2L865_9LACO|nr:hypothetical protein [Levilactobacillus paucivorans]KRN97648.1 hypothetical protein IV54_GL001223 [Levilactobacillus paucivorans]
MYIQIPTDMDEVQMRQLQLKQQGETWSEDQIIHQAVLDTFQAYLDQIEDGHYDTATWQDEALIVTDINGDQTATVQPQGDTFIADFRKDADQTSADLEQAAIKASGAR